MPGHHIQIQTNGSSCFTDMQSQLLINHVCILSYVTCHVCVAFRLLTKCTLKKIISSLLTCLSVGTINIYNRIIVHPVNMLSNSYSLYTVLNFAVIRTLLIHKMSVLCNISLFINSIQRIFNLVMTKVYFTNKA